MEPTKATQFNLNRLIRKNVRNMTPYSSARDEYVSDGSEKIFLDANENPFGDGINRYPDPQQRILKSQLAERKGVSPDQILLGNGSDEVLDLIFRAFCEPGRDNVITVPPTYGMYSVLASLNHVENRKVLLKPDFTLDLRGLFTAIDEGTRIVFLCSPNNPSGNSLPPEQITEILNNFKGLVVLDEAYIDFSDQKSWVTVLSDYPNLIVTQTFSKAYGMAGIRLGVCYASVEVVTVLNKIKPPYNVNELTQRAALERLRESESIEGEVEVLRSERRKLERALDGLDFVRHVYPSDANFILVEVDDADRRYSEILKRGFIVRNRSNQPLCENCLRFTVGTPEENRRLIEVLIDLK
ncbi:histidinol-phosphate aminotransferase [Muriicola jejuensis]|uniref:Histidinol-phosphate aminotransferase n=1 Tax=Muriicola jejuensis TaxID=504488 RepID=A0A6P0UF36_9FLAO|nr:histidinol-phosphate transaminase [Muriicola jejuensis]NER11232.1 histidinol-phosphate transaminase [Muriicola jejuensis]SMP21894.1 histidinol-phosphate aminotransferase [Muriicola jejuensis]